MKPTMEILERIRQNSERNKDEVFTRLYRYMLRPDLYYLAYQKLHSNQGAATKGIDNDTADGFSENKIKKIIQMLSDETYEPKPARRTYIQKANGKLRPLGIPTFTDKLIQEVLKMILEAVHEPVFLEQSHGFRPNRSCHTALKAIDTGFTGIRWFVEGDIKGCFDNIDHHRLVEIIGNKIKDARLIKLVWKFLKAGYLEDWKYHNTQSGTPQGGIISPLFANIYLHELDKFVVHLSEEFNKPSKEQCTKEYKKIVARISYLNRKLKTADGSKRASILQEKQMLQKKLRATPSKLQVDKKLKYIRYADDFLIGVNGNKEDCENIKRQLTEFISDMLKMELSAEKTLITHSSQTARFLGYDIRVRRENQARPRVRNGKKELCRTLNGKVELLIPLDKKIMRLLFENKMIFQTSDGRIKTVHRSGLLNCTELEIVSTYNAELRGICNYYSLASNFNRLNYFAYLMEYSCLKTLAAKHKTTVRKIKEKYKDGNGSWGIPYTTKKGKKRCYFAKYMECKNAVSHDDCIPKPWIVFTSSRSSLEQRLSAQRCELCGKTDLPLEIHHVNKVKNLKGKSYWEQTMIAKRRKTLVVCEDCHFKIHGKRVLQD